MVSKKVFISFLISVFTFLVTGCRESNKVDSGKFSELAVRGKQVFESHKCGECHAVGAAGESSKAPNLSQPVLASDSSFVQMHLKFVEQSKMPPIQLTDHEIRSLSHYIAEIHAANQQTVSADEADSNCPVCNAPVSIEKAIQDNLSTAYSGEEYYFECRECLDTFKQAPEVYLGF